jgi:O-antigen ligase
MIHKHRGSFTIAALVTFILFCALFLLGMPLDGHLGRFSFGSFGSLGAVNPVRTGGGSREIYVALVWGSLYLISFWVFFQRIQYLRSIIKAIPFYILFLAYLGLSSIWSNKTSLGLFDISQLIGSGVIGAIIALRYRYVPDDFISHAALALGAAQLLSTVLILAEPSLGIAPNGRWVGMYGAPNYLGSLAFCSLWANVAVISILKPQRVHLFVLFALSSAANLFGTNSITSIWSSAVALGLLWVWPRLTGRGHTLPFNRVFLLLLGVFIVTGYLFGLFDFIIEALFSFSGRSVDLTGRLEIWGEAYAAIVQKPIFGSGFGTTFILRSIARLTDLHSSYITALFSGGFVAFTLLFLSLCQAINGVWQLGQEDTKTAHIIGPMLLALVMYNFTETALFDPRSSIYIIFVILIVLTRVVRRSS